ncbi:NADH:ubiquinone oxidoreductase 24 [Tilletia horrida]|nr:NADH:ubiquinone oxidoreductase 24 [Tilletia horrida]
MAALRSSSRAVAAAAASSFRGMAAPAGAAAVSSSSGSGSGSGSSSVASCSSLSHRQARRHLSSSARAQSDVLMVHRDTSYNNASIPFTFNEANARIAQEIIAKYPAQYKKAAVIPLLDLGQRQNSGWTSISVMNEVARLLEMPPMRVYEVASFYTMFNR